MSKRSKKSGFRLTVTILALLLVALIGATLNSKHSPIQSQVSYVVEKTASTYKAVEKELAPGYNKNKIKNLFK